MGTQAPVGSRPKTLAELDAALKVFFDEASRERGLAFQPRPSDIIITPHGKCGTTWLQQIAHGLRSRGSMDFDEINAVTPWIEIAYDVGWDLDADQVAEPRLFKSHRSWETIPKGARYLYSFRRAEDAIVSLYRFFEGWMFEPGNISLEDFVPWNWPRDEVATMGYWQHIASWWEQRDNPDVLLLCYEDMQADLPGTIRRIARFMGITLDDDLFDIVLRQSSREYMLAHKDQFDERHIRAKGEKRAGLPPPIDSAKVTAGVSNETRYQLSAALKQELDEIWREQITPRFGLETYDDLRHALRELHRRQDEGA
jgi:hypothetical protein